ncbi:hypothetical protein [Bosea psychrotolerans]|uniref:Uncharacterized protein n=1 Tax=Bosea psychrotolerans TaxID=1871628 RepID=A0A2S4MAM3_9HYPH|nr:hypothetical protein [Bosea psychrotolerans]POR51786.1 hypothetical protein CYD53_10668 [Bosea psychrotolerans]
MPRLKLLSRETSTLQIMYLIDLAVGRGCPNRRGDVLLVQFFIRLLQDQPQKLDGEQYNFIPSSGRQLKVDGVCGEETIRHIAHFKQEHDKSGAAGEQGMLKDLRIDPMLTSNPFGVRTGHVLSILRLNQDVAASIGAERFRKLYAERLFPQELRNEFFI